LKDNLRPLSRSSSSFSLVIQQRHWQHHWQYTHHLLLLLLLP
jgi:hypothetical protein